MYSFAKRSLTVAAMRIFSQIILGFLLSLGRVQVNARPGLASSEDCETIHRDVAVIGGGSTGTYTALRLHDQNFSVAIVEPKNHLGGNAETYITPDGWTIDIGVIVFGKTPTVRNYFQRFNVSLVPLSGGSDTQPEMIDFNTGTPVANYKPKSQSDIAAGLANYAAQLEKYPGLASGFNLTYPIAPDSDLLLPFGEFAQKYNLSGAMPLIFSVNQGYSPLLSLTTLYMFKYLNGGELDSLATGFLTTERHDIQELYQKVNTYLGPSNVFLNSSVTQIDRSSTPARIRVQTPGGCKMIMAKKVVITAAPTLSNLQDIDLSPTETNLFAQFSANGYYTGVLTNTSLPNNFSASAAADNPDQYDLPILPGLYSVSTNPGAPGYVQVYYGSPTVLPSEQVQTDIVAAISRIQKTHSFPQTEPEWATFSAHTPFNLHVTPAAIQDRFYEKLFALQGQQNTFWNGAAWDTQDSSVLWQFTDDYLMPRIVASLR